MSNLLLSIVELIVENKMTCAGLRLSDTSWDDLKFPASADRLDVAATRYSYDYAELGISFNANARYPNEVVGHIVQMPHHWKEGSSIQPHVHWVQSQAAVPNWLIEYRPYGNGDSVPASFTQAIANAPVFTYPGSGSILQISTFPNIAMTGLLLSSFIDVKIYRDTTNASGLFAGADPVAAGVLLKEFDAHYEADSFGSDEEFIKDSP